MELSSIQLDPGHPWWADYLPGLKQIDAGAITNCDRLNSLLPGGLTTLSGHAIQFVPSSELGDTPYEYRIYKTGKVSTRADNWHDLFNALVWTRFPRIKVAMNAVHYQAWGQQHDGRRGKVRDALTLFDECGVILCSDRRDILTALAERRWKDAFMDKDFSSTVRLSICGHAILEKYLKPYKSMTAKALLLYVDTKLLNGPREDLLAYIDDSIARGMLAGELLTKPACLSPLPLAGLPGWWMENPQDIDFYNDKNVFRPAPETLVPAGVLEL